MPDIDIRIRGSGGAQTAAEVRQVIQALADLQKAQQGVNVTVSGGVAGGIPVTGGGAPVGNVGMVAQQQVQMASGVASRATQDVSAATTAMNSYATSIDRARHRVAELRRELADLDRVRNAGSTTNQYRAALDIGGARGAPTVLQRALDPEFYSGLEARLGEAEERVRNLNARRIRPGEEVQASHVAALLERDRMDSANATLNRRLGFQRIRTQEEEVEAYHHRAGLEEERRQGLRVRPGDEIGLARQMMERDMEQRSIREQRQQLAAMRAEVAQERSIAMQGRRDNMDRLWGGMILSGAGTATLGALGGAAGQFGQAQMTRVGLQAVEGGNAANVERQAREMALSTFGAGYRDILEMQNRLRLSEMPLDQAQNVVKSLNDINAALGGSGESMQRLVTNLEQVQSVGHLTGQEMRDFARNRLNLRPFIAQIMGIQANEVESKQASGEISADVVNRAIIAMGQDPRFRGRAAQITETTLPGQWEKTREEMQQTAEIAGEALSPALGTANRWLRSIMETARENPGIVRGGALVAGGLGLAAAGAGGVAMTQYGLGAVGNMMPDRWMQNPMMSRIFGGTAHQRAATTQLTAANLQLQAARMQLAGGAAGALPGGAGAAAGAGGFASGIGGAAAGGATAWYARSALSWGGAMPFMQGAAAASAAGHPLIAGINSRAATMTLGGVAGAGAMGAVGGLSQYQDFRAMGEGAASSMIAGAATGITEAAIALFIPGGAIAVGLTEGIRLLVNQAHNVPLERRATEGSGFDAKTQARIGGMNSGQQADEYFKLAEKKRAERDALLNTPYMLMGPGTDARIRDLDTEIESAMRTGHGLSNRAGRETTQTRQAQSDKEFMDFALAHGTSRFQIGDPSAGLITNKPQRIKGNTVGVSRGSNGRRRFTVDFEAPPSEWEQDLEEAVA